MDLLFIADPLASFKTYKDTTFAMMRTAAQRGHRLFACEMKDVQWHKGSVVQARVQAIALTPDQPQWFSALQMEGGDAPRPLRDFDAVLMRKDPPFDSEYFYATHMLSQAEREGAKVFNKAAALRNHPEKLSILEFPDLIGPTLVTRSDADIRAFHAQHQDIILKPLDGMGGSGIFRVPADGLNLGSIIETLNRFGTQTVMVQRFLPKIAQGDKRILLVAGQPIPFCLARIPQGGEVRGNLAAGGKGVAQALSDRDREIAQTLGATLYSRGLMLVGLDVIGDHLTEINVTSPTGFQEITHQTGFDVAAAFITAIEQAQPTW